MSFQTKKLGIFSYFSAGKITKMRIAITIITLFFSSIIFGQHDHGLIPCGTEAYKSDWLKQYQKNKDSYPKNVTGEIYVPLNVGIVGNDNATGLLSETTMLQSFCTLTEDFSESEIVFYLQTYRTILDSDFFEHNSVLDGAEKMLEYDTDDAINCYFMGDPAGTCGYNLPYASIVVSNSCAGPEDHTWAHELGHQFSLPHPFLGWEGGVGYQGETPHNFADPAPEIVVYNYTNFQDTLILDTLIIDTAFVEFLDGSNCDVAADGFCDTSPDYLAQRWACDSSNDSFMNQHDPNGEQFKSDGTLIMSYAFDACASRFSEEQVLAMRASIEEEDAEILTASTSSTGEIEGNGNIELFSPFDSGLDGTDIMFEWSEVEHADYYLFQILIGSNGVFYDTLVTTTNVWVKELNQALPFNWTVIPFNSSNFCNPEGAEIIEIEPVDVSSVNEDYFDNDVRLIPNLITDHPEIRIESKTIFDSYSIYVLDGQKIAESVLKTDKINLDSSLEARVYFVRLLKDRQQVTLKFVEQ